jgi:hypothetical protein
MQIEHVAITIHEAAELLREAVTAKIGADYPIKSLVLMSYDKPLTSIEFDAHSTTKEHRWEQHLKVTHYTRAKP